MSTFNIKAKDIKQNWHVIDANNKVLGRLATKVATILCGKHKPIYTPHLDTGDFVVITNAEKIRVTGKKEQDKVYYHHTGYQGGIKEVNYATLMAKHPTRILLNAIKGMLPKGPLGRKMLSKLKVYAGEQHPHHSQQPKKLDI